MTRLEAETQDSPVWTSGNSFYSEGDKALGQVAQGGCGVCPWWDSKPIFLISSDTFSQTSSVQKVKTQGKCTGRERYKGCGPEWLVLHDPSLSTGVGPDYLLKSFPTWSIQWFLDVKKPNNMDTRKVYCIHSEPTLLPVLIWNWIRMKVMCILHKYTCFSLESSSSHWMFFLFTMLKYKTLDFKTFQSYKLVH